MAIGQPDIRNFIVKCHKSPWFGYVCRHDTLAKIVLWGTVDVVVTEEDGISHGGMDRQYIWATIRASEYP